MDTTRLQTKYRQLQGRKKKRNGMFRHQEHTEQRQGTICAILKISRVELARLLPALKKEMEYVKVKK